MSDASLPGPTQTIAAVLADVDGTLVTKAKALTRRATSVTASNEDEGFAKAIEQFVLPRAITARAATTARERRERRCCW